MILRFKRNASDDRILWGTWLVLVLDKEELVTTWTRERQEL